MKTQRPRFLDLKAAMFDGVLPDPRPYALIAAEIMAAHMVMKLADAPPASVSDLSL